MTSLSLHFDQTNFMNRRLSRTVRNLTIISDLLLVNLSFWLAYLARYEWEWLRSVDFPLPYSEYISQQVLFTVLIAFTFSFNSVWRRRRGEFWVDEMARVVYPSGTSIILLMAITFFFRPLAFSRLMLVWIWFFVLVTIGLTRLLRRNILALMYLRGIGTDRALIIGSGEASRGVIRTLLARPDLGYQAIGYLDEGSEGRNLGSGRIPHLGHWRDLPNLLGRYPRVNTVFIALPDRFQHEIPDLLDLARQQGLRAFVVPDLLQLSLNRVQFSNMAGIPMLSAREVRVSRVQQVLGRALDLAIIAIGAIPTLVIGGIIAIAIKLDSPGPVLFAQERVGRNGRRFRMIKFRSMVVDAEAQRADLEALNEADGPIFKIKDDPRLTRVGRIIRRLSLDELPQLINVLRGEMRLVGPRPPIAGEVEQYEPWHEQRLVVPGGMTGLWQVSGRSDLTFDEQCLLDIYYIENWSIAMDLRIMLQTLPFALFGRGAY